MPSAYEPPSNLADLPDWLLEQENEIAVVTVRALSDIIDRSLDRFASSLTAAGDMSAFDDIPGAWSQFVSTELADRLGGLYLAGGVSAWVQAPGTEALTEATAEAWTQVVNTSAVSYAQTATNRLTGPVADSIWNDLRLKVSKAIESGMSTERLATEIRTMGEFSKYRAETIARTEANGAYNAGNYESNQTLGDVGPVEKYWVATGDDRTRLSHREADGQVRAFADPFIVGGAEMLYPHDPAGPAKETINCRCVAAYLYPGMERPDGTIVPEAIVETTTQNTERITRATSEPDLLTELRNTTREGMPESLASEADFVARLTDDEIESIRTYTGSAFEDLNYQLRRDGALSAEQTRLVRDLDSAIAKAGTADEPFVTYRGMTMPEPPSDPGRPYIYLSDEEKAIRLAESVEARYPIGSRTTFGGGYASSSTHVAAPMDAGLSKTNKGVVFEIQARRGAPINAVSKYQDEFEVILPRDAVYEVVGIERDVEIYDFTYDRTTRRVVVQLREVL